MKKLLKSVDRIEKLQQKINDLTKKLEIDLTDKVEFGNDFSLSYQPSDGLLLEHEADCANIKSCINIIFEKGFLSTEDFFKIAFY